MIGAGIKVRNQKQLVEGRLATGKAVPNQTGNQVVDVGSPCHPSQVAESGVAAVVTAERNGETLTTDVGGGVQIKHRTSQKKVINLAPALRKRTPQKKDTDVGGVFVEAAAEDPTRSRCLLVQTKKTC